MTITVDESAVKRIEELRQMRGNPDLVLRILVDGGGCSGFQYIKTLADAHTQDDQIFSGVVATDSISLPFLSGSVIRFDTGLIGSEFVIENPNAVSGCGCGTSFSV